MTLFRNFKSVYANAIDPYIPSFWARESLLILEEQMVAAGLVHRDFEPLVAQYGDVVNTRKPGTLEAMRKTDCEDVTVQDISATNLQVKLDQHVHTSFLICDGQESKSMVDLVNEFMRPAITAQARFVDKMVLYQYAQFLNNSSGKSYGVDDTNGKDYLIDVREIQNKLLLPLDGRFAILNPRTESDLLRLDLFSDASVAGSNRTQVTGELGPKFGYNFYLSQNMPSVPAFTGSAIKAGAINMAGGYGAGTTGALVVDGFTGIVTTNSWIMIDGLPYRVIAHTETTGNTTGITLDRPLYRGVADDAVIKANVAAAVNLTGGYPVGYAKEIVIDAVQQAPVPGQAVSFTATAGSVIYTIIKVTGTTGITLDRPLEAAIADDAAVNFGPPGNFNFFFHRNAIALVIRPLALPKPGAGALASVINRNNMSMRATISYDPKKQGHLITLDFLCGIKVLDEDLGATLVG